MGKVPSWFQFYIREFAQDHTVLNSGTRFRTWFQDFIVYFINTKLPQMDHILFSTSHTGQTRADLLRFWQWREITRYPPPMYSLVWKKMETLPKKATWIMTTTEVYTYRLSKTLRCSKRGSLHWWDDGELTMKEGTRHRKSQTQGQRKGLVLDPWWWLILNCVLPTQFLWWCGVKTPFMWT